MTQPTIAMYPLLLVAVICWATAASALVAAPTPPLPLPAPLPGSGDAASCQQCFTYTFIPPPDVYDFPPYRFYDGNDTSTCVRDARVYAGVTLDAAYLALLDSYNSSNGADPAQPALSPMLSYFADGPASCTPTQARFCGTFVSKHDAEAFAPVMLAELRRMADEQIPRVVCALTSGGYAFQAASSPDSCVPLSASSVCPPAPDPFPECRCNKTRGITPLFVQPKVTVEGGRSSRTSLFCFTIDRVPESARVYENNCSSNFLSKVEIWANDTLRYNLTAIRVTPKDGPSKWLKPTWALFGQNTLKATPLMWTLDQAVGGQVCLELKNGAMLEDFCVHDEFQSWTSACYLSLFNEKRDCCPAFGAAVPSAFSA